MNNLIKTEAYKWLKSKTFRGLFIYFLLILFFLLRRDAEITAIEFIDVLDPYIMFMFIYIIVCFLGLTVVYEFKTGYIESAVANGYSREKVYLSKLTSYILAAIIFCVLIFVAVFIAVILISGAGYQVSSLHFYNVLKIFSATIFLIFTVTSFINMVSFISKRMEIVVFIFLLDWMFFALQQGIQNNWFRRIMDNHPYNRFIIALGESSGLKEISLLIGVSTIAVFLFNHIGINCFKKSDI